MSQDVQPHTQVLVLFAPHNKQQQPSGALAGRVMKYP